MSIKENFAANLIKYRKAAGFTQAELAEKINYSDKAVSKWERAESVPDLEVVKNISDLFEITIDALVSDPKEEKPKMPKNTNKLRAIIYLSSAGFVWLLAICCYALSSIIFPHINETWPIWLALIYAVPISSAIIYVFASVWKNRVINLIFSSIFLWSLLTSVFLSLITMLDAPPAKLWGIFLVGIPVQALLILKFFYKRVKK